jgi:hypothetical protein
MLQGQAQAVRANAADPSRWVLLSKHAVKDCFVQLLTRCRCVVSNGRTEGRGMVMRAVRAPYGLRSVLTVRLERHIHRRCIIITRIQSSQARSSQTPLTLRWLALGYKTIPLRYMIAASESKTFPPLTAQPLIPHLSSSSFFHPLLSTIGQQQITDDQSMPFSFRFALF